MLVDDTTANRRVASGNLHDDVEHVARCEIDFDLFSVDHHNVVLGFETNDLEPTCGIRRRVLRLTIAMKSSFDRTIRQTLHDKHPSYRLTVRIDHAACDLPTWLE